MDIIIRQALAQDTEFLIDSIVNAEKSGREKVTYCQIFSISEEDLRNVLRQILDEEIEGFEFCIQNFLIAELGNKVAGAISGWIEGADGMPSSLLKMNAFSFFLPKAKIDAARQRIKLIEEIAIEREAGCLQLDCVYTIPEYSGQGISGKLIDAHLKQAKKLQTNKSQIILMKENATALRAYEKAGFHKVLEKVSDNLEIADILPGSGKILLERQL